MTTSEWNFALNVVAIVLNGTTLGFMASYIFRERRRREEEKAVVAEREEEMWQLLQMQKAWYQGGRQQRVEAAHAAEAVAEKLGVVADEVKKVPAETRDLIVEKIEQRNVAPEETKKTEGE